MHILNFDCTKCGNYKHGLRKTAEFPSAHEWLAQCLGCGKLSVKAVDDTRIESLAQ